MADDDVKEERLAAEAQVVRETSAREGKALFHCHDILLGYHEQTSDAFVDECSWC